MRLAAIIAVVIAATPALAQDGGVYPATRATLEQLDGGVVAFPADGGVVLVGLEPWKAVELADERRAKDAELARLRAAPHPVTWLGIVAAGLKLVLDTTPVVLGIWQAARQP